ncbi:MAG TPA: HlyD family efflux transporter periplasmic adaptor subunit [Puia sp.]
MPENNIGINGESRLSHQGVERAKRADAVQEIISRQPSFIERWALLLFLLVLLLLFAGTWFIKYPDMIQANATLTAANAPKEILVRQDGKLTTLFVANDSDVKQGGTIGWIESTASHKEVLLLYSLLDSGERLLSRNETERVSALFRNEFLNLGELQASYQQFISSLQQFNDYLVNGYYYKRKRVLFEDLAYLQKMHQSIDMQKQLVQQDFALAQETVDANNSLYNDKVISKQDLRDQKSKLVGKQLSIPQLEATLLTNENTQASKEKEIDELEHAISQQKTIFRQALETLRSLAGDWKKRYIITAPIEGKVVFIVPLQENQFMQSGKTIGYVNPPDSKYYAQITLPQSNFGKVDTGQKVQFRFDAYPYQEFGFILGRLKYISKVPSDSGFLATVELPNGLITNYNKTIQYRNGLRSQALIVTRDARLIQRFYYNFIKGTSVK